MAARPPTEERQRNLEKQRRKIEREKAAGFVRRLVTIPIERDAELKEIVSKWRAEKKQEEPPEKNNG